MYSLVRMSPCLLCEQPEQKLNARIMNWEPMTPMKYLKSNCIGKFVSVRGT